MVNLNELKRKKYFREEKQGKIYPERIQEDTYYEYLDENGRLVAREKMNRERKMGFKNFAIRRNGFKYYDERYNVILEKCKVNLITDKYDSREDDMKLTNITYFDNRVINITYRKKFDGNYSESLDISFRDYNMKKEDKDDYLFNNPEAREFLDMVEKELGIKINKETLDRNYDLKDRIKYENGNIEELTKNNFEGFQRLVNCVSEASELFEDLDNKCIEDFDKKFNSVLEKVVPMLEKEDASVDKKLEQLEDIQEKIDIATHEEPEIKDQYYLGDCIAMI